jgi:hypothetical protein
MNTIMFETLNTARSRLLAHPMYKLLNTPVNIRIFMKHHVFAVWDFMSLLKRLQKELTCMDVPWMPSRGTQYTRFINEIVLGEESDKDGQGGYTSHFELYLKAMEEIGAEIGPIVSYLAQIQTGTAPIDALASGDIPLSASRFVQHSLRLAFSGKPHEVAAAFFFGREDIIPDMFHVVVDQLEAGGLSAPGLKYYLQRHIELDGDEHGPLAEKLLIFLCDNDPIKISEAEHTAFTSLQERIALWDGVAAEISRV